MTKLFDFHIKRRTEHEEHYGYQGRYIVHYQDLYHGDTIVDTETIPYWHLIDMNTMGSSEWRSKWADTHPECYKN